MGSKAEGNQVHVSKVFRILILGININHILVASLLKIAYKRMMQTPSKSSLWCNQMFHWGT